ncbi:unnamed protein product [Clavelina lepadiformis]|uniref:C-type lectin domain-containing protein n=1 Tax=Clavelina lepadiformis TaxID=159417 RepID=A0ABP0GIH9_CLALP
MILTLVIISLFVYNCHGATCDCQNELSQLRKELEASVDSEWFVPFNGYKYKLTHPANWTEARSECQELGGDLATVGARDSTMREIIWLRLGKPMPWIGLHDLEREGEFTWIDGAPADNLDWDDGEPNNMEMQTFGSDIIEDEDCGNLSINGKLNDDNCSFSFINGLCEIKID